MTSKSELVDFIKNQILIEKQIVKSLNMGLLNIKNLPVKAVLKGISLDSIKHAELYAAASELLTKVSPALQQENLDTQIELVEKHIRLEEDLIEKLEKRGIGGAGLDVYKDELNIPKRLKNLPNVVLTPHTGSATIEARLQMTDLLVKGIKDVLAGRTPENVVSKKEKPKK